MSDTVSEDSEKHCFGYGVVDVNSDNIDDGEETTDFGKDLRKL